MYKKAEVIMPKIKIVRHYNLPFIRFSNTIKNLTLLLTDVCTLPIVIITYNLLCTIMYCVLYIHYIDVMYWYSVDVQYILECIVIVLWNVPVAVRRTYDTLSGTEWPEARQCPLWWTLGDPSKWGVRVMRHIITTNNSFSTLHNICPMSGTENSQYREI